MVNKIYGIYTHANPSGRVFYVGKGTRERSKYRYRDNRGWNSIVNKYGFENLIVKFKRCKSEKHALKEEIKLIKHYKNKGVNLVNKTIGGDGVSGLKHKKSTKLKLRKVGGPTLRNVWKNKKSRAKILKAQKASWTKERRLRYAEKMRILWKTTNRAKKFSKSMKLKWKTKGYKENFSNKMIKVWKNKKYKTMMIKKLKLAWKNK